MYIFQKWNDLNSFINCDLMEDGNNILRVWDWKYGTVKKKDYR